RIQYCCAGQRRGSRAGELPSAPLGEFPMRLAVNRRWRRLRVRKAIVMAGGQGTRLQPLTLTRPKPMVPVANRPVMAHILEWLKGHGFSEVLVTLHYRADDIRRAFGDGRALGLKITYRVEREPLGTAGSVKFAEDWIAQ